MLRSRVVPQLVAAAVLLSLLLTACRVTEVPATAYPAGGGYPGPRTPAPTHAAAAVQTTAPTGQPSPVPTPTAEPVGTPFTLTILHTGEVAGEVLPCGWNPPKGGLARRATAIAQLRAQVEGAVLVLDTGNGLFGREPSNSSQGALQIQALNLMGYDAMAWGETDLAVPAAVLRERFAEARFAAVSANLGPADQLPLQPYVLQEIAGHKVAILGATAPAAAKRTQPGIALTVDPPLEAISRTVAGLRGQADVIIVLSNLLVAENEALALQVPGIDVLLGARDAQAKMGSRTLEGPDGKVVVAVTYRQGQFMGQLTVRFDEAGRVVTFTGQDLALNDKYANNPAMVELLTQYGVKP